jgi:hypothetical protein
MKIAILGWGSLIWDPGQLPYKGSWLTGGPQLQIEFSRVSNDGRLTLVIDLNDGESVPTRYVKSTRTTLAEAIDDLRAREGSPASMIGFVDLFNNTRSKTQYPLHADVFDDVADWCKNATFDAVVWTALPPNFQDKIGQTFSVNNAITYLQGLQQPSQQTALDYIKNAPTEVDTPVRRKVTEVGLI